MNRRHFVMSSAAAAGATFASSSFAGPNDTVRVAVRRRSRPGQFPHQGLLRDEKCRDRRDLRHRREHPGRSAEGEVESSGGSGPPAIPTFASCSKDKDIDAISIATPNHNHALQTIWGVPGRQTCVLREAALAQYLRAKQIVAAAKQVRQDGSGRRQRPFQRRPRKPCRTCATA